MSAGPEPIATGPDDGRGAEDATGAGELARQVTDPRSCPYLHDRPARTELRLHGAIDAPAYGGLLRSGFRRFGMVVFRPACEGCAECVPIRVPVDRFQPSRSQRRVIRRNLDV